MKGRQKTKFVDCPYVADGIDIRIFLLYNETDFKECVGGEENKTKREHYHI